MSRGIRPTRKRPSQYHHGDLSRALLDAARLLVERHGPTGWTMRQAARLAGVTSGAPYHHYRDRLALVQALAQEGFERLDRALAEARAACSGNPLAELDALGATLIRFAREERAHYRVMYGPESFARPSPALHEAATRAYRHALEVVHAAQARGVIRAGPAADLALLCWSTMHGVAELSISGRLFDAGYDAAGLAELAARLRVLLFVGLAPRGEPARSVDA